MSTTQNRTLKAPVRVSFDYTRTVGPVIGRFLTSLRDGEVIGARTSDGRITVPPPEFDPVTHQPVSDFVAVSSVGTVVTWTWVPEPVEGQPFDRPFAYALIQLDGADTPLLHAIDVASPTEMATGMRVQVRWADAPQGRITDIACFEPADDAADPAEGDGAVGQRQKAWPRRPQERPTEDEVSGRRAAPAPEGAVTLGAPGAVTQLITPVNLDYIYAASPEESSFFRGLAEGRVLGQRCPKCHKVYVPPRSACPEDGVATTDEVELAHTGTVTTFCIVNVPFLGQRIKPPYVSAYVLLDGADIAFLHLVQEIDASEVRMGMRVEAVWKPREEWGTTIENILHFRPTGEPDADYDTYQHHL